MAEIRVPYEYGGRQFEGMLVFDDSVTDKRPAMFVQPDWLGVCPHSVDMARQAAGKDYVVLMADMYGVGYGDKEKTEDELLASATGVRLDLPHVLGCGAAAVDALTNAATERDLIEPDKLVAIGYCMGGGIALEQARAGADFQATVVFHVTRPNPVDPDARADFKGRVLAIHGSADPVTPQAGVDWEVTMFGHAVHSFCVEGANNPPVQVYDERLCQKSYRLMRDFFDETL